MVWVHVVAGSNPAPPTKKRLDKYIESLYTTIMETLKELKKFDAVLRMSRFSTKRKGNDKKRLSKKLCRKKVSWEK